MALRRPSGYLHGDIGSGAADARAARRTLVDGAYNRQRVSREVRFLSNTNAETFDCAAAGGVARAARACPASAAPAALRALRRTHRTAPCCAMPARRRCPGLARRARSARSRRQADGACGACLAHPPPYAGTVAAFAYAFPVDRLLQRIKYGGRIALAQWAGAALAATVRATFASRTRPRPAGAHRGPAARGGAPARARASTRRARSRCASPAAPGCRSRRRWRGSPAGPPQAALPWAERRRNVRGAFAVRADGARRAHCPRRRRHDDRRDAGRGVARAAAPPAPSGSNAGSSRARCRPDARPGTAMTAAPAAPGFAVVLVHPEIPPNTGNVIRLTANTATTLHLVEPLGFRMDDRELKRAGLDYHEYASVRVHRDFDACRAALDREGARRWFAFTTDGPHSLYEARFAPGDVLVFGRESSGLPRRRPRAVRRRGKAPDSDAAGRAQPQSVECGCGRRLRGVAADRFRRRRLTARRAAPRVPRGRRAGASLVPLRARLALAGAARRHPAARGLRRARHGRRRRSACRRRGDARARAPRPRQARPRQRAPGGEDLGQRFPAASARPTRRLRDRSPVQVSTRSPRPARPISVSRRPPSAADRRPVSASPRVISAARALWPKPRPSLAPAAIASTFFTAPPIFDTGDVVALVGAQRFCAQQRGDVCRERGIGRGDRDRRRQSACDFLGKARSRDHAHGRVPQPRRRI